MSARKRAVGQVKVVVGLLLGLLVQTGCRSTGVNRPSGCCAAGGNRLESGADLPRHTDQRKGPLASGQGGNPVASAGARAYGGQKTCPVTGEELGSMGPPIPINVQGQTVYVCCRGCAGRLQRDPDVYLAKMMAERAAP